MYAHAGAVLDGRMYVTCGRRGLAYLRETYCFDPATDQWEACADGPVERAWHGVAARGGRLYVIGGSNDEHSYRRDVLKVGPSPRDHHAAHGGVWVCQRGTPTPLTGGVGLSERDHHGADGGFVGPAAFIVYCLLCF